MTHPRVARAGLELPWARTRAGPVLPWARTRVEPALPWARTPAGPVQLQARTPAGPVGARAAERPTVRVEEALLGVPAACRRREPVPAASPAVA